MSTIYGKKFISECNVFEQLLKSDFININSDNTVEDTGKTVFKYFFDCHENKKSEQVDNIIILMIEKGLNINEPYSLTNIYQLCYEPEKITRKIIESGYSFSNCKYPIFNNFGNDNCLKIAKSVIEN